MNTNYCLHSNTDQLCAKSCTKKKHAHNRYSLLMGAEPKDYAMAIIAFSIVFSLLTNGFAMRARGSKQSVMGHSRIK